MDETRIKEVFADEAFAKELLALDEPAEVQAMLGEKGIELTIDEIMQIRDQIGKAAEKAGEDGELSMDQLDEAAGGLAMTLFALALIITSAVAGAAAGELTRRRW